MRSHPLEFFLSQESTAVLRFRNTRGMRERVYSEEKEVIRNKKLRTEIAGVYLSVFYVVFKTP